MEIDARTLIAIALMAGITYATRVLGVWLVRRVTLGPRLREVLDAAPGIVLVSMIAPAAVASGTANLIAAAAALLAALRLPLPMVIVVGVATAALARRYLG